MRLLMVAPPGSGKGTQAQRLAQRFGIEHIASGELLRHEVEIGSEVGLKAREYVDRGDLVPDEVVLDMVISRVLDAAASGGYVLDGYPRNVAQAEAAYATATGLDDVVLQAVMHLKVGRDELRRRLRARARREGRGDDTAATIEHRLEVFDAQTEPLLGFYQHRGILHEIDGELPPDEVTDEIVGLLGRLGLT